MKRSQLADTVNAFARNPYANQPDEHPDDDLDNNHGVKVCSLWPGPSTSSGTRGARQKAFNRVVLALTCHACGR